MRQRELYWARAAKRFSDASRTREACQAHPRDSSRWLCMAARDATMASRVFLLIALLASAHARPLLEDGATYSLQDVNGTYLVADPDAGDSTLRYEASSPPDAVFTAVRAKRGRWYLRFGDANTGMLLTAFGNYKTAAWCDPACGAVWRIRRRRRDGRVALSSAFIGTYLHSSLDNFDVEQGTVRDAGSWWTLHKHDGPVATPTVGERLSEALESVSTSLVSSAREFTSMLSATDAPADEPAVRPRGIRLRPRRAYAAAAAVVAASTALVVPSQLVGRTIIGAERSSAIQNLWRNSELRRVLASGTLTGSHPTSPRRRTRGRVPSTLAASVGRRQWRWRLTTCRSCCGLATRGSASRER